MSLSKKSKLETLSKKEIDLITAHAEKRRNVPLVKSTQVNMRLDAITLKKIKLMAKKQGVPYTTYIAKLLLEDIERLWSVFNQVKVNTK